MRDLMFTERGTPASQAEVDAAQVHIGQSLPADLVEHYLTINGGSPEICCFFYKSFEYKPIHEFLPLTDALHSYDTGVAKAFLPEDLFPFAIDEGGNYICIARDKKVYFYVHDIWDKNQSAEENRSHSRTLISESYEALVAGLITMDEAEAA